MSAVLALRAIADGFEFDGLRNTNGRYFSPDLEKCCVYGGIDTYRQQGTLSYTSYLHALEVLRDVTEDLFGHRMVIDVNDKLGLSAILDVLRKTADILESE